MCHLHGYIKQTDAHAHNAESRQATSPVAGDVTIAFRLRLQRLQVVVDDILYTDQIVHEQPSFRCRRCGQEIPALIIC